MITLAFITGAIVLVALMFAFAQRSLDRAGQERMMAQSAVIIDAVGQTGDGAAERGT